MHLFIECTIAAQRTGRLRMRFDHEEEESRLVQSIGSFRHKHNDGHLRCEHDMTIRLQACDEQASEASGSGVFGL